MHSWNLMSKKMGHFSLDEDEDEGNGKNDDRKVGDEINDVGNDRIR